jgi:hypothetical protein
MEISNLNPLESVVKCFLEDICFQDKWTQHLDRLISLEKIFFNAVRFFLESSSPSEILNYIDIYTNTESRIPLFLPPSLTRPAVYTPVLREILMGVNKNNIGNKIKEYRDYLIKLNLQKRKNKFIPQPTEAAFIITWLAAYLIESNDFIVCFPEINWALGKCLANGLILVPKIAVHDTQDLEVKGVYEYQVIIEITDELEIMFPDIKKLRNGISLFYFYLYYKRDDAKINFLLEINTDYPLTLSYPVYEKLLSLLENNSAFTENFSPGSLENITRSLSGRRGQQKFREELLSVYKCCMVTGSTIIDILEAAHINPYSEGGTYAISNGLLLRSDIHTLFDLRLIAIDSKNLTIILSPKLMNSEYKHLHGKELIIPSGSTMLLDTKSLDLHRFWAKI